MKTGYDQFFKNAQKNAKSSQALDIGRMKAKLKDKRKVRFPIFQFLVFGFFSVLAFFIFDHSEDIEKQLKKIEIGVPLALAEEKPNEPAKESENKKEVTSTDETHKESAKEDSVKKIVSAESKPDEADYLFKLSDKKKQLDKREEELNKYAAEISKQKEEIEEKLKKLEETRQKISNALEERIKTDDAKVDTLVQMYSNMKPQQAAKIFETLDEELVIEILSRMKKKSAAEILNLVKPEKAQVLAERYVGYRVPASK